MGGQNRPKRRSRLLRLAPRFLSFVAFLSPLGKESDRYTIKFRRPDFTFLVISELHVSGEQFSKCPSGKKLNRMNRMLFKVGGLVQEGPPMWTCENRPKYNRDKLRYPSD